VYGNEASTKASKEVTVSASQSEQRGYEDTHVNRSETVTVSDTCTKSSLENGEGSESLVQLCEQSAPWYPPSSS
jgi:hypothetical protein